MDKDLLIRIGLVQMYCEKSAIDQNLERMSACIEEAAARDIDILGFPEMSLTGYADPTRYPQAMIDLNGPEVERLCRVTRHCSTTVLAGLIEKNPAGKPFITQVVVRRGALQGYYRKTTIKDEEAEWFSEGTDVPVFQHNGLTFGMAICADIGNEAVFAACGRQGAQIIFELAAPGLYGEQATRDWRSGYEWWEGECREHLSQYTRTYGFWIGVATQAGRTVDEDFPGGGYVFAPNGERVYATTDGSPGAAYLELDLETGDVTSL
jgi:predicted amidohydrolase